MAEKDDPKAPYTVRARLNRNTGEESLGTASTMDEAEALAETAVHSGPYAIAHIYDRDSMHDRTVRRAGEIGGSESNDGREPAA